MNEHRSISIADQIFDQLEKDILSGKYQRGEVLSELRLSKELGVSRTPIREALLRLEQENLITGSESEYGLFVETVDGETADSDAQEWWCFTKGGEMLMTGVDDTVIADGEHYEVTFTVGW